jgi:hypothetical protein
VIVAALAPRLTMPVVVVELILGIALGPQGAELADVDSFTNFVGNLGLGMLFFVAGYEIDFERIRRRPLELGLLAWAPRGDRLSARRYESATRADRGGCRRGCARRACARAGGAGDGPDLAAPENGADGRR